MIVEVFKTNVTNERDATMLVDRIHNALDGCRANFDLTDCDRVLRVATHDGLLSAAAVVDVVRRAGFHAEVLPDEIPAISV